jgi:catechol 2,3-dioxygenase-like lactoylglutathione lyase family enzyme
MLRIASVTVDCRDVARMVDFWSQALGYSVGPEADDESGTVEDPNDRDVEIVFIRVPEEKSVKNRVHFDLGADDRAVEVERLVGLGAEPAGDYSNWTVMRDPEGNEFCVIQVAEGDSVASWRT